MEKEEQKRNEYNMNLNDTVSFTSGVANMLVMRVPGGWIYTTILEAGVEDQKFPPMASSVFVPLHEPEIFEFPTKEPMTGTKEEEIAKGNYMPPEI